MEEDAHSDIEIEQDWPMHPFTTDGKFTATAFHQDNEHNPAGLAPTTASVSDAAPKTPSLAPPPHNTDHPLPSTRLNPLDDDDGNNASIELDLSSHDGENRKEKQGDAEGGGRVILLKQQGTGRSVDNEAGAAGQERENNGGWMGSIVKKCRRLVSGLCSSR